LLSQVNGWHAPSAPEPRIGVVGCGYWGAKHVRVLSGLSDVKNVTVIDCDQKNLDGIRSAFPAVRACSDLHAALPHVDALIIASPPQSHAELALEALRAGKHVLVEKPLATCADDARALVREAERQDRILMVGHTFEFNPAVIELRRRLQRGDLGAIYYVHSSRLNLGLFRRDVNVVWDLAPHDVSILNYILGSFPTAVTAWGLSHAGAEVEVLAYLRLEYEDIGVTGYVHVSWLDPKKVRKVVVVGSERMAVYNDLAEERLRIYDRGVEFEEAASATHERPLSYRYGDILSPHIQFQEPLLLEDRHFVECIRTGAQPQCDGLSGLQVVSVLEAADRSLQAGGAVRIGIENDIHSLFPQRRTPAEAHL
jgi:predicted dehydrogenase